MRLIGQVKRLEGAARAKSAPATTGICWSRHEARVSDGELAEGEYVAVDVTVTPGGGDAPESWAIKERVTLDAADLGSLYNGAGEPIGQIVSIDPEVLRYELYAEGEREFQFLRSPAAEA